MKLVAIILTFFTITLAGVPCDDDLSLENSDSISFAQDSHDDSHSDADACSPFCTCVCCASLVTELNLTQEDLINKVVFLELNSSYTFSYTSDYLNRIFQPPQV